MRAFEDDAGRSWVADVREEATPRHHGRWYLVFHQAGDPEALYPLPEVRWQTRASGERTLATMAEFELRRRLLATRGRAGIDTEATREEAAAAGQRADRGRKGPPHS